ncbi:UDP-2,3-diacylglucosamine diphosphatase [Neisseria chenwenguii]|uniref:UDP-2,3-diacylglucosamine hydrolase n=1 Tax=Neisseria chenwenguii TaxID=1853278 RepID=A0A220S3A3_9NEIS|nr:UDP-2,3-diacylglucosamine diphosphatase [Neisseria chenwenguii]ASK27878.1 UDP-2,3-diacylglucosamine diphosphatase [Neisseria chenwenguii]ROV56267.1 UDP-2,3-diacylglucosamine diphosphatase [Neisseria chenwenguii]
MPVYFIADLHLSESRPELTALFLRFMRERALQARAVYILGDLFDFWVGDDEQSELIDAVQTAIRAAADVGVECFFVHGNRDFLIGSRFAERAGLKLLPEYHLLDLFGEKTLICHGDTLCTDDVRYQRFRKIVHCKWLQGLFLRLPLSLRLNIARKIRRASKSDQQYKPSEIMDVNPQFTAATAAQYGVRLLIHGHTHRQAVHENGGLTRIVLGDWHADRASVLRFDENGFGFEE